MTDAESDTEERRASADGESAATAANEEPSTFGERMQARLGVTAVQWFFIETALIFAPYLLFAAAYVAVDVPRQPFLIAIGLYSIFAFWASFHDVEKK